MPNPKTYTRALEAAEAPQASPHTAPTVAHKSAENVAHKKSAEKAQNLIEQAARAAQTVVQQANQNLDLALQLTGTAASGYQSVLAGQARQAMQRTQDALTQASQVRSPTALLDHGLRRAGGLLDQVLGFLGALMGHGGHGVRAGLRGLGGLKGTGIGLGVRHCSLYV